MDSILGYLALMSSSRQALGRLGETQAIQFSTQQGFKIIEHNFRTAYGEIDLIVQKEGTIVFVEVKTRSTDTYDLPETSVTLKKRQHLISCAQAYSQATRQYYAVWRIDMLAIRNSKELRYPEIVHFENAVTE